MLSPSLFVAGGSGVPQALGQLQAGRTCLERAQCRIRGVAKLPPAALVLGAVVAGQLQCNLRAQELPSAHATSLKEQTLM